MNLLTLLFGEPSINALDAHRKAEVKAMIEKLTTSGPVLDLDGYRRRLLEFFQSAPIQN